ncbi:MAG: hypothetical protein B1H06_06405 [Candidatus Cloacimonas sp. 4484_143]|nr:MAG: hypothetical protein B1H06_06405 [Candidatus Cloacimonas sp. 4484_143]
MLNKIKEAAQSILARIDFEPEIGIILGTGLNSVAEMMTDPINIPYEDIPHMSDYEELGERFPSMNEPYSHRLMNLATNIAQEHNFIVKTGVYTGLTGPSLETLAECKMFAALGSDLVGMSTVPEVIVAVHGGMEVFGISVVTNLSNIFHSKPHSQEEIRVNAEKARLNLEKIILNIIEKI